MKQAIDAPTHLKGTLTIATVKWHKTRVVPQVADTDYGGGIYHGRYFGLYNIARDIFFQDMGVPYISLMDQGINISVAELHTRFQKSVFYGDWVMVHTRIAWLRTRSFGVEQKMICTDQKSGKENLKNELTMNMVCTDSTGAVPVPDQLKKAIFDFYDD